MLGDERAGEELGAEVVVVVVAECVICGPPSAEAAARVAGGGSGGSTGGSSANAPIWVSRAATSAGLAHRSLVVSWVG